MRLLSSGPNRLPSTVGALSVPSEDPQTLTRRRLLQGMLAVGGVGMVGGLQALREAAEAAPLRRDENILVLVTLDGGNDALNTVVPINDGRYRDLRGGLAITSGLRPIGGGLGLHPNLRWMKQQHDAGRMATFQTNAILTDNIFGYLWHASLCCFCLDRYQRQQRAGHYSTT